MRVPTISPEQLSDEQRPLYDDMCAEIGRDFLGFRAIDANGGLLGPFNAWMSRPRWGESIWQIVKAFSVATLLPRPVREVAILVTGAHFRAAYEIYAHVILAEARGLDDAKLATIVAGERPANLTGEESVAYDVASALVNGHVLPELTYRRAVQSFGEDGAMELIYLVGLYCFVSVTLNGFDIPIPE
jgi:4-carboxymuconolactone decarboxylase